MNKKAKVKFKPLIKPCTYHHKDEKGVCKNCGNTMLYQDGHYLIFTNKNGLKQAFYVDTIK